MADDMSIKLLTEFEEVSVMNKKLQSKLKELINKNIINLKLDLDGMSIREIIDQSQNAQKKIQKIYAKPIKINAEMDGMAFNEIESRMKVIRNSVDSLAKVNINTNANGKIQSAMIEYRNEAGKVTKEFMNWHNHLDKASNTLKRVFGVTKLGFTDDIAKADTTLQKSLDTLSRYEQQLKKIKTSYNLSSGVNDASRLQSLDNEYNNILGTIDKLKNSQTILDSEQKRNITEQIANLSNLVLKYKDVEKTQEKGFNYQGYKEVTNEVVRLKTGMDAYSTSLLNNHKLVSATVQETENYYKVTQQLQQGNYLKNIGVYIDKASGKVYEFSRGMKNNMVDTLTWSKALQTAVKRMAQWATGGAILFGSIRVVKQGIADIRAIDDAMIGLKKVTNETKESYENFRITINETAKDVGHTTEAAIEATTAFAKLGYTLNESSQLAKSALIYSNIGDISIDDSIQSIISTMKAYGMEIQDVTHLIDVANEVGKKIKILPRTTAMLCCNFVNS